MLQTAAIVLAAGKGTRMKSNTPKVLHKVSGLTLVEWVLRSLAESEITEYCLVVSENTEAFEPLVREFPNVSVAIQRNRLGTGDAAAACAWSFKDVKIPSYAAGGHHQGKVLDSDSVLICAGDVPAVDGLAYRSFLDFCRNEQADVAVFGMEVPNPKGYGRLVIEGKNLVGIIEEKDADEATRRITVCNTGILFFKTKILFDLLCRLDTNNAQKEFYLTDCIAAGAALGLKCKAFVSKNYEIFQGVNDREQLASVEKLINARLISRHMGNGVSFHLRDTSYVEADVSIGSDTIIGPGFSAFGRSSLGANCHIGANVVLDNATVADGVEIGSGSVIVETAVPESEKIYPGTVRGFR